jgi:Flp pilus assembly protein TadD
VPLAHDLSRSPSTILPAAVLGIVLLVRARPAWAAWPIAAVLAFNLLTPARHVVEGWDQAVSIHSLRYELNGLKHPPTQVTGLYVARAAKLVEKGDLSSALTALDTAVRIAPTSIAAQINRAIVLDKLGRPREAAPCYDAAVRLGPKKPDVHFRRAQFRYARGELEGAEEDLRATIAFAPTGSPIRAAAENNLAQLLRAMGKP